MGQAVQVSEFSIFKVGDATNTLQELTAYTTKVNIPTDSQATTVTTLVAGGGQVTDNIIRGPKVAPFTADFLFDDTPLDVLNQVCAARGGSTVQYASGNNALPAIGDMLWQMTGTLHQVVINYNVGTGAATMQASWQPSDGGAVSGTVINPGYYPY